MGFYEDRVLPRVVDKMCGAGDMARWREKVVAGLAGTVVEIGFGSGLNVALYPPAVELVYAVEPAALAGRLAAPRIEASSVRVEHVGLDGESLPLDDGSCDAALCTFTLCTIPHVEAAVAEVHRVLRPGGTFHFLEHGIAPDEGVVRWQRRLEPLQKRLAGGCHLTRDPVELVTAAGFTVEQVERRYAKGPKPWCFFTVGVARR
ncbi:MAG: Methyltransferase type 11 [Actinomycetia bacterium]|jgi:ubiquinone/menaquinone biosynthesis C-methylase UbiE|nr:Methyltransferase type 11 [Actinomycetes bacterium]